MRESLVEEFGSGLDGRGGFFVVGEFLDEAEYGWDLCGVVSWDMG